MALREPMSLVSRYITTSPRSRMLSHSSPTKHRGPTTLLATTVDTDSLDILELDLDIDSDIEIIGPYPSLPSFKHTKPIVVKGQYMSVNPELGVKVQPTYFQSSSHKISEPWKMPKVPPTSTIKTTTSSIASSSTSRASKSASKKEKIPTVDLPPYTYKDYTDPKPYMVYTQDEAEADDLVVSLKSGPMALDIEWRVFFTRRSASTKMTERRSAVVQIADTRGVILVVQVYNMDRFPKKLQTLIENPDIPKLGVNILNDGKKLFRDYGIVAKNLVELGAVALVVDPEGAQGKRKVVSLAKLVERYCGKALAKGDVRTGNWEAELDPKQLEYAANDVHSSLMVYQRLLEIAQERAVTVDDHVTTFSSDVEILAMAASTCPSLSTAITNDAIGDPTKPDDSLPPMRPQYLRAYRYWYEKNMAMGEMCLELSLKGRGAEGTLGEGLKISTVISYIVSALQADPNLPFEMLKLWDLVQTDGPSWVRHREWILRCWGEGRGVKESEDA